MKTNKNSISQTKFIFRPVWVSHFFGVLVTNFIKKYNSNRVVCKTKSCDSHQSSGLENSLLPSPSSPLLGPHDLDRSSCSLNSGLGFSFLEWLMTMYYILPPPSSGMADWVADNGLWASLRWTGFSLVRVCLCLVPFAESPHLEVGGLVLGLLK